MRANGAKTVPMGEILPTRGARKQPMILCADPKDVETLTERTKLLDLDSQSCKNNLCWI